MQSIFRAHARSIPSIHQRGRHLHGQVVSDCLLMCCVAPPSLPTALPNLAGTGRLGILDAAGDSSRLVSGHGQAGEDGIEEIQLEQRGVLIVIELAIVSAV